MNKSILYMVGPDRCGEVREAGVWESSPTPSPTQCGERPPGSPHLSTPCPAWLCLPPPPPIRRWGPRTQDADQRRDRPGNSPGETETPFLRRACWPHSAHRHQWISLIPSKAFENDDEHFLAFQPSNVKKWAHWILCQCKLYIPRVCWIPV